jgi:hypothetical protein
MRGKPVHTALARQQAQARAQAVDGGPHHGIDQQPFDQVERAPHGPAWPRARPIQATPHGGIVSREKTRWRQVHGDQRHAVGFLQQPAGESERAGDDDGRGGRFLHQRQLLRIRGRQVARHVLPDRRETFDGMPQVGVEHTGIELFLAQARHEAQASPFHALLKIRGSHQRDRVATRPQRLADHNKRIHIAGTANRQNQNVRGGHRHGQLNIALSA